MSSARAEKAQTLDVWIAILVLGSLWGFSEVVLSSAIRAAGLPYRAAVLTGIGMGLMAVTISVHRKPWMLAGIALVAVLCKQLVVPVLHVSVMCKANSCIAVMLGGVILAGAVSLAGRRLHRGTVARIATGAAAALLSAVAFHFVGMRVAPCRYLLTFNRAGGLTAFVAAEGVPWAVSTGLLFPIGCWIGERLEAANLATGAAKPHVYHAASAAIIILCWVTSALAIAAGF